MDALRFAGLDRRLTVSPLPIRRVVIGVPHLERARAFWSLFGYRVEGDLLSCGRGADIELRETASMGPSRVGWDLGPRGLDVYVADIEAALERLADSGVTSGPIAEIAVGPVRMRQCAVLGTSAEPVVLVESTHRRPSLLDDDPSRWCSEVYSVVWCVASRDAAASDWASRGATLGPPLAFSDPSMGPYLSLPVADAMLEMVTIADAAGSSTRLELLSFPGREHHEVRSDSGVVAVEFADGSRWSVPS